MSCPSAVCAVIATSLVDCEAHLQGIACRTWSCHLPDKKNSYETMRHIFHRCSLFKIKIKVFPYENVLTELCSTKKENFVFELQITSNKSLPHPG